MIQQNYSFEAMPQSLGRLEEKVEALTILVNKLTDALSVKEPKDTSEKFIGTEEACGILHLSTSHLYSLVQDGRILYYKPGKKLRFLQSELIDWMKQSRRDGQQSIEEQMAEITKGMRNSSQKRWMK